MSFTNQFAAFMGMKFLADAMRGRSGPDAGHTGGETPQERSAKNDGDGAESGAPRSVSENEAGAGRHLTGYDPVPRAPVIVPPASVRVVDGDTLVIWPGKYRLNRNWRPGNRTANGAGAGSGSRIGDRRIAPETTSVDPGLWGPDADGDASARDLWVTHEPVKVRFRSVAAPEITWSLNRSSAPPKEIWGDLWEKERAARLVGDAGDAATRALTGIIHGRSLCIAPAGIDRYGRLLADVFAEPGFSVEHALLDTGLVTRFEGQDLPNRSVAGMPYRRSGPHIPGRQEKSGDQEKSQRQLSASRAAGPYDPPALSRGREEPEEAAIPAGIYDPF